MTKEIKYVPKKEVKEYKKEIQDLLVDVAKKLKNDDYYYFSVGVVGSAKRNLVLRKGNSVFDVDFQLFVFNENVEANYRETIRKKINEEIKNLDGKWNINNSTSVITIQKHNGCGGILKFFDVALIRENDGREISKIDKNNNEFIWNQILESENHAYKRNQIKGFKQWNFLRENYKNLRKNQWNLDKENKKPSSSLFIETINNTYNEFHN